MKPPMTPESWVANNLHRDPWSLLIELGEFYRDGFDKDWIAKAMDLAAGQPWPVPIWEAVRHEDESEYRAHKLARRRRVGSSSVAA